MRLRPRSTAPDLHRCAVQRTCRTWIPPSTLAGRAVLVTGAARRIGAAIARGFHAHGADVCIHCHRSVGEAEQLRDELNAQRPRSATSSAQICSMSRALPGDRSSAQSSAFGRLDVLINNASTFYPTPLGSVSPAQWDDLIGTNLRAPFFLAQAAAPQLRSTQGLDREHDRHSRSAPAAAASGLLDRQGRAGDAHARAGSRARPRGARQRHRARTDPVARGRHGRDSCKDEIVAKTLLKRSGSPEDVVRAALFFVEGRAVRHGPDPGGRRRPERGMVQLQRLMPAHWHRVVRSRSNPAHSSRDRAVLRRDARSSGAMSASGFSMNARRSRSGRGRISPGSSLTSCAVQQDVEIHRARRPLRRIARPAAQRLRSLQLLHALRCGRRRCGSRRPG